MVIVCLMYFRNMMKLCILLFASIFVLTVVSQQPNRSKRHLLKLMRENSPTEDQLRNVQKHLARAGVQIKPFGTGLLFSGSWKQIITFALPSFDEYTKILNDMKLDCRLYEKDRYKYYDTNTTRGTMADMFYFTLSRRCLVFQEQTKRKTFNAIKDAFQNSLPQPDRYQLTDISAMKRVEFTEQDIKDVVAEENTKSTLLSVSLREEFGLGDTLPTALPFSSHSDNYFQEKATPTVASLLYSTTSTSGYASLSTPTKMSTPGTTITNNYSQNNLKTSTPLPEESNLEEHEESSLTRSNSPITTSGGRKRRHWIAKVGKGILYLAGAIGLVGTGFEVSNTMNRDTINKLTEAAEKFANGIAQMQNDTITFKNDMAGLTYKNQMTSQLLRNITASLGNEIDRQALLLKKLSKGDLVTNQIIYSLASELDFMSRLNEFVSDLRHRIRTYENAISQLQNGFLPSTLLSYAQLRAILKDVKDSLREDLSLVFETHEVEAYYSLPLSTFVVEEGMLMVRLDIPVKSRQLVNDKLFLFRHQTVPIPNFAPTTDGITVVMKSLPEGLLAFKGDEYLGLTHRKHFHCLPRGEQAICLTFFSNIWVNDTECLVSLISQPFSVASKKCVYRITQKDYQPIELETGVYYIHGTSQFTYIEECENRHRSLKTEKGKGYTVSIPPGCVLKMNGMRAYGGRNKQMKQYEIKIGNPFLPERLDFNSSIRMTLDEDLSVFYSGGYNPFSSESNFDEFDADVETMLSRWRRENEQARSQVLEMQHTAQILNDLRENKTWGWRIIQAIEEFIIHVIVILLFIGVVREASWTFLGPPLVNVVIDRAHATSVPDFKSWINDWTPDFWAPSFGESVDNYLTLLRITIVCVAFLLIFVRAYACKVVVSHHEAVVQTTTLYRFWIELSFVTTKSGLLKTHKRVVYIRTPLRLTIPDGTISCVLLREKCVWFSRSRYDHLSLSTPLEIRGIQADGTFNFVAEESVLIEWPSLEWLGVIPPNFFDGSHGEGVIRLIPDPHPLN